MNVIVERTDRVVTATLNRPEVLNALSTELLTELLDALEPLDRDPTVGCFVITGSERAFAAGADIAEMATKSAVEMLMTDFFAGWERFTALRTPKIAAVSGYALGGGCELAMMCDFILASDTAKFGQPEIKLGVTPGMGGSQRLTHLVGKAKAMDMILTGRMMDAEEAERAGLVSRVVPAVELADGGRDRRGHHRLLQQAGHDRGPRAGRARARGRTARGPPVRAPHVPRPVRHRRPVRGHARLPG